MNPTDLDALERLLDEGRCLCSSASTDWDGVRALIARVREAEAERDEAHRQLLAETYRTEGGEIVLRQMQRLRDEVADLRGTLEWVVTKPEPTNVAGLELTLTINGRTYVIQPSEYEPSHPVSLTRWHEWEDEDCAHDWEIRPESDTRACLYCGAER